MLFLQGGASLQFSMSMNFLPAEPGADYVITGVGERKLKEAKRAPCAINVAANMADAASRVSPAVLVTLDPRASYVHITTNETIEGGVERERSWLAVPLIADASSDILSHPPVDKYGLIYAGRKEH